MTPTLRRLAAPTLALALGCAGAEARLSRPDASLVVRGQSTEPLPAPRRAEVEKPPVADVPGSPAIRPVLPVSLDAVFRLAEGQNPQLAVARARVQQAFAERDLAAQRWLPDIHVGAGYYRHEGGIQDQDGRLI